MLVLILLGSHWDPWNISVLETPILSSDQCWRVFSLPPSQKPFFHICSGTVYIYYEQSMLKITEVEVTEVLAADGAYQDFAFKMKGFLIISNTLKY